jgi:hypothetical protein
MSLHMMMVVMAGVVVGADRLRIVTCMRVQGLVTLVVGNNSRWQIDQRWSSCFR